MFNDFDSEEDYIRSLKQKDHYHFSIPFEYIEKNYGNDTYDIAEAIMEIDVDWDESNLGYRISHYCPDMNKIDPAEGNGDEEEIYVHTIEQEVLERLDSMGISFEVRVGGIGR